MPKKKRDENKVFAEIDALIQSREETRKATLVPIKYHEGLETRSRTHGNASPMVSTSSVPRPPKTPVLFEPSMIKDDDKPVLDDTVHDDTVRRDTQQKKETVSEEEQPKRITSAVTDDLKEELLRGDQEKSDLARTCELLLNEKWRKRKTRLRQRQVSALSTLETLAVLYDVKFLREWIDSFTEYLTSEDGRGRQDIVDIAKYTIDKENDRYKEYLDVMGRR